MLERFKESFFRHTPCSRNTSEVTPAVILAQCRKAITTEIDREHVFRCKVIVDTSKIRNHRALGNTARSCCIGKSSLEVRKLIILQFCTRSIPFIVAAFSSFHTHQEVEMMTISRKIIRSRIRPGPDTAMYCRIERISTFIYSISMIR